MLLISEAHGVLLRGCGVQTCMHKIAFTVGRPRPAWFKLGIIVQLFAATTLPAAWSWKWKDTVAGRVAFYFNSSDSWNEDKEVYAYCFLT